MIYLASTSPRRAQLLEQIGYQYQQLSVDIEEISSHQESAKSYVIRMAKEKADHASDTLMKELSAKHLRGYILAADTIIAFGDEILGKPKNQRHYSEMMHQLSNNWHHVYSSISLIKIVDGVQDRRLERLNISRVFISALSDQFINSYWETGEPADKAAGYAIQGKMASYIERIDGSYSGIMGLPLCELREALEQLGYNQR